MRFRSTPNLIACAVLQTTSGLVLIDPGPASTLDALSAALDPLGGFSKVHSLLLTHIHLDHAGASGLIVQRYPEIEVYVHPAGAPHLVQPERLIRSARRIYHDELEVLWGPILPVPERQVRTPDHGQHLYLYDRCLNVKHTPGHASHHLVYHDVHSSVLFAGDAAGMRVLEAPLIIPVAPPPDIDIELWDQSLETLGREDADRLFLTHFGPVRDVKAHLDGMHNRLHQWSDAVRTSLDRDGDDHSRALEFHKQEMAHAEATVAPELLTPYKIMGQPSGSWYGLARYWRKKQSG